MIGRYINRIILIASLVMIIVFTGISLFLYNKTTRLIVNYIENSLYREVNSLADLITDQNDITNKNFFYKIKIVTNYINSKIISEAKQPIQLPVYNINTQEENIALIRPLLIQGQPFDEKTAQYLKFLSQTNIAVLQKFDDGYIITYSDLDIFKTSGNRYYFPNSSDIAFYINNKQFFFDKIKIKDKTFKAGIIPIFIGKEIKGAILLLTENLFSSKFQTYFESRTYLKRGYPVLIDQEGTLILHPALEGENIHNTALFFKVFSAKNHKGVVKIEYKWPETQVGDDKILYIKYLPNLNYYVGISIFKDDLYSYTQKFRIYYILAIIISLITVIAFFFLMESIFLNRINSVRERLEMLSQGQIPEPIEISGENYIALEKIYNKIIDNFRKYSDFARELSKGNYDYEFIPVGNKDILGEHLLNIQQRLKQVYQDIQTREKSEKIRAWRNQGVEKFIDILSRREQELTKWSFEIIKAAVEYVDAFQGGLFVLEEEEDEEPYFTLLASYAFNEEKLVERKIPAYVGLFAKLYKAPKLLYIDNFPGEYQIITSALGQVQPKSVILVPLMYDNKLIGAIELDAFHSFEQYQLEFLEEIANHISASLSSWKVAQETQRLLKKYEEQTQKYEQQQIELQNKVKQLEQLSRDYKTLKLEYETTIKIIDEFTYRAVLDTNGKITDVNYRFSSLYQKNRDFFLNKYISEFSGFDIINPEYKTKWDDVLKGRIVNTIEKIKINDQDYWLNEYFIGVKDANGQVTHVIFLALDITELKMLERQLKIQVKEISKETRLLRKEERKLRKEKEQFEKEKKQLKFILDLYNKTLGRIVLNRNKIILEANPWITNLLAYTPEEMIDKPFDNFILQSEKSKFDQAWELALEGQEITETIQFLRKDGNASELNVYFYLDNSDRKNIKVYLLLMP